jgi:hypothetical protein
MINERSGALASASSFSEVYKVSLYCDQYHLNIQAYEPTLGCVNYESVAEIIARMYNMHYNNCGNSLVNKSFLKPKYCFYETKHGKR